MDRRAFIKASIAGITSLSSSKVSELLSMTQTTKTSYSISDTKKPVAIAMWDFSWLLRHYPTGEFENWDVVLDDLVERGYNGIRMDVFPHEVAADSDGKIQEEYFYSKIDWKPKMWGNNVSMTSHPREALLKFIPKCQDRGIHLGLSTWFWGPRRDIIKGFDEFVRVWDETITFLKNHDLLNNIYYIDLLNEYPMFHGFKWFHDHIDQLKCNDLEKYKTDEDVHLWSKDLGKYNLNQTMFYRKFMTNAIKKLKRKWPTLDIFTCQTYSNVLPWETMDMSEFEALDIHYWLCHHPKYAQDSGYWENIHNLGNNDLQFKNVAKKMLENWSRHNSELNSWLENEIQKIVEVARNLGVPYGSTEGWGPINWLDHPSLGWDLIKEAGEIGAKLGSKYSYSFNCSSNFTHPQFSRLWNDVQWHKKVTSIIRNGY